MDTFLHASRQVFLSVVFFLFVTFKNALGKKKKTGNSNKQQIIFLIRLQPEDFKLHKGPTQ